MTVRALLDVNVLIALFDIEHVFHLRVRDWWVSERAPRWASCPLTQNGFLRVISNPGYSRPLTFAEAASALTAQMQLAGHEFWPDDASLLDDRLFVRSRILGPGQLTDIYLLGLAVKNDGRFVTLDRTIPIKAVRGAEPRHLVVI